MNDVDEQEKAKEGSLDLSLNQDDADFFSLKVSILKNSDKKV